MTHSTKTPLTRDIQGLIAGFAVSGTLHMAKPAFFEPIVPRALPSPRGLVYASGVAELACAIGLLHPRTRKAAGWASVAVLVAVFPGNIQMAVTEGKRANRGTGSRGKQIATLARLPLQIPLIRTALKATGRI